MPSSETQSFFTPELFRFLAELKKHNRRDWFLRNKERYEAHVKEPALRFITYLGPELEKISGQVIADPRPTRGSLFRIYRDTRFSSDKRPYKTHVGMHFRHAAGRKDVHAPGFYLHLEPQQCFLAGGLWQPPSPELTRVRQAIVRSPEQWKKAVRRLELEGDALRRPPRGYDAKHPMIEDLKRKDYIASVALSDAQVCSVKFMSEVSKGCRRLSPLLEFLSGALGMKW